MSDHEIARAGFGAHPVATRRALRTIALFEALKGAAALAAGFGLLGLLHRDVHHLAEALVGHLGLDPGERFPSIFLHYADMLQDANWRSAILLAGGYSLLRFFEAYGLWHELAWGQWLGALSGALYVPFEITHLAHHPGIVGGAVVAINLVVIGFLAWQLRQRRRAQSNG